jgi:streptogramin lyase
MRSRLAVRFTAFWASLLTVALLCSVASAAPSAVGTITEFSLPVFTGPWGIAAGPDTNLWFTEAAANGIGRITPAGVITEYPIPTQTSYPRGIVSGPDGNLWFVESHANKIGRITPAGVISEFLVPLPTGCFAPLLWDITAGPDGNLWFTDTGCAQIGRITTTGGVTEFQVPTPGSNPLGITTGPDGHLWFTEDIRGGKIAFITTAGTVTEFPTLVDFINAITSGPDGNMWFTQEGGPPQIGRITLRGRVTTFRVPTPDSRPRDITAGPDGNLWFTEYKGGKIGQITPAGKITEFPIIRNFPHPSPQYITPGSDGNLWFTEYESNKIGRITDAPALAALLSPNSGPPGSQVQVSGSGYGSFETVVLTFADSVSGKTNVGRVLTDFLGGLSTTITSPRTPPSGLRL